MSLEWIYHYILKEKKAGEIGDRQGQVEFIARYKNHGRAYRLHEKSDFVWQAGCWYYTQGTLFGQ